MDFIYKQDAPERWEIRTIGSHEEPLWSFDANTTRLDRDILNAMVDSMEIRAFGAIIITKNCHFNYRGAPLEYYTEQRIDALRPSMV